MTIKSQRAHELLQGNYPLEGHIIENTIPEKFSLEDRTDYWSIHGVAYRDGIYTVDLSKTLLDNGSRKTQEQWSKEARKAKLKNQPHVGDLPLDHASFTTLYRNKDGPQKKTIEQVRTFLEDAFSKYWLMSLTRIIHTPSGKDKVIHNYGLPDQYEVEGDIVGPDELVKHTSTPATYKALLGTDNTTEIQHVYKWITKRDLYLWRLNEKPRVVDERVAGFVAISDGVDLGCDRRPDFSSSGLGVRVVRNHIPGALSLAEAQGGELSLSSEAGSLSLVE